jgi:hypothetical protein
MENPIRGLKSSSQSATLYEIRYYRAASGKVPFKEWINELKGKNKTSRAHDYAQDLRRRT